MRLCLQEVVSQRPGGLHQDYPYFGVLNTLVLDTQGLIKTTDWPLRRFATIIDRYHHR